MLKLFSALRLLAIPFLLVAFFSSCNRKTLIVDVNPEFSKYIEAYTSGVISKKNVIRIQLAANTSVTHTINENISEKLFEFSPSVQGKAYWVDARTIEFKPENDLAPEQFYTVTFHLDKVIDVPNDLEDFQFNIQVIKPSFEVQEDGLRSSGKDVMSLSGNIITADVEASATVEKLLTATISGKQLPLTWQHNETAKSHQYFINNIPRSEAGQKLLLQWKGDALSVDEKGSQEIYVPSKSEFIVLSARPSGEDEQYISVLFSDAIATGQMLDGLISVSNTENPAYTINGSEIKLYASETLEGNYTVTVQPGIENTNGKKLSKSFVSNVNIESNKPSVKISGRGSILPNSTGKLVLPFEAVNLNAVDVSIIRIYENNIAQFLQSNALNGDQDIRRVGKPLVEATVRLDNDKALNLHRRNSFSLDLDKFVRTEPGALYRVTIGFRPQYSLFSCDSLTNDKEDSYYNDNDDNAVDDSQDFWSRYDNYYPYGYNWDERDNPCFSSYYNKERFATRNILASNLGLLAKMATDKKLFVAVSNIISTEAENNVDVEVLDYQQQIIASMQTTGDGTAVLDINRKPYLLIAKKGNERGYLKLDDGSSLPLSRFDVSGAQIKNGIKGFIFGERGVWRPGDSLFLSCLINDKENPLPKDYPLEMEIISPRGQLYQRLVQKNAEDGFNVFRTATDADAPTGNWTCRVKAGGASFEKKLRIETVMPNRLKINVDFGNAAALGKDANVSGTLNAKWLFGAPAQNLKATVDAQLYKKQTSFKGFDGYVFDDPTSSFESQSKTIFDGTLSADGVASINPSFDAGEDAPGQLLANLVTKVFEPGGNFSIDNFSMPFNPYSSYAGIKAPDGDKTWGFLQAGQSHPFSIADVDVNGKPVQGNTKVEIQLYKIQWRWWWDENESDDLSNFTQNEYNKLVKKDSLTLNSGKGIYNIKPNSDDWGRYLILVKDLRSGHTTGTTYYVEDYYWQSRAAGDDPSAAAMLSFTSDKEKYNVGDDVNLTIPSSKGGRMLISIESGSKVVKTFWKETDAGQTKFSFKADENMSPNIYVNVSLIQPHAQTVNSLPIRMYGVIPVLVENKKTILQPAIQVADVIRPETKTNITVSEKNGNDMTYVIAVVDEGLLDLTRFKTPDPHDAFYAREALGVKTFDVYDDVIGAFTSQIQRILTIGGDAEAEVAKTSRRANRFAPVVKFMGPYHLNGKSDTHSFTLPAYMGSVRAMVIAAGDTKDAAYGMAEKTITVKKPLMILPTLPRVVGPGEEIKIPVSVFADNSIHNVSLSLQGNAYLKAAGNQTITFNQPGEQEAYFTATVKNNTGIGKIKIVASGGKEQSVYETEIEVRNPNSYTTQVQQATLQPGQTWNGNVSMIGDAHSSKAAVEISSIPAMDLEKRLTYLITYPHGCIEQTTSAVFPQLVLNQLTDLSDKDKAFTDRNIKAGIQKLQNFQTPDGGFSYWPGDNYSDEWGSNYAGNFLLEAQAHGYAVSQSLIQQWVQYERGKALAWNVKEAPWYGSDLTQAYRLYLLALADAPEQGAMNRLKEFRFLSPEAKWRLAAAYYLTGQTRVALQLISGLSTSFPERKNPGPTFGSNLRDQAMVLESLTIMKRMNEATQLVRSVASQLSQEQWYSTQTTAYALIALAKFSGNMQAEEKIKAAVAVNGSNSNISSKSVLSQTTVSWQNGQAKINVSNKGKNVLYVRVINEGKPIAGTSVPFNNNAAVLRMNATYMRADGNIINIDSLKQGTDFVAKVTVTNPAGNGDYTNLALTQIFPSGWEVLNTRLYNSEGSLQSSPSDYMDIRDDRVYYYFGLESGETKTFYVQLNAAYLGRFYWPGVYCEAMYDHTISAGLQGKMLKVVKAD